MTRLLLIFLVTFSGLGGAAVTAAWKLPIEPQVPDHETNGRVRKLEKPSGESAFFEAGDEIWDVSKALSWSIKVEEDVDDPFDVPRSLPVKVEWKGDWVVWNARSGMFIARGPWSQILLVEKVLGFNDQPIMVRSRVEIVEGEPARARSLSFVSSSGEKARASLEGFEAEVEGMASGSEGICDVRCRLSWPAGTTNRRWNFHTGVTVREEARTRLARQGKGPESWEAWLTVSRELLNGTPLGEARWIETEDGIEPWTHLDPGSEYLRKALGPNRELGIYPVSRGMVAMLAGEGVVPILPDVVPPDEIAEWIHGSVIEIGELLRREFGVTLDPAARHFAGFDPRTHRVILVADPINQDLAQKSFSFGHPGQPLQLWFETNGESGGWGLVSRSGEKAGILRTAGEAADLLFEIEPTLGADGRTLGLRYKFDFMAGDRARGRVESAITLTSGDPVRVVTHSEKETDDLAVVLTGTVTGNK